jgi:cellulose synthase/poly-beta-1,6-N-acetylglucosamine synthase-like glycosyltransferase
MTRVETPPGDGPVPFSERAARLGLTGGQIAVLLLSGAGAIWAWWSDPGLTAVLTIFAVQIAFLLTTAWRAMLLAASLKRPAKLEAPTRLPRYTVLVALYREADVVPQLVERLSRIDYPHDRLEGFLVLEACDHDTEAATLQVEMPSWLTVLIAAPGPLQTKPRALNVGLERATGELLAVYDAEDDPDPLQLREAAARFEKDTAGAVWAVQAPLRVRTPARSDSPFLNRQFAIEYASLFEVTLAGLSRLGLPFPLGGTSNHFRVDALRAVGGWDTHNVTEDADLGFRLWRAGGRLDVISRPTHEPPPGGLQHWLPQRTRWLKGYMQTWGVHTRDVRGLGWKGGVTLSMTLGAAIAAAALHAVSLAWIVATVGIAMAAGVPPETPPFALTVLVTGVVAAWVNAAIGCRRAGLPYTLADMLTAPAYWSLLSLAFIHAAWRLVREPFAWDKTVHFAEVAGDLTALPSAAGREAA